MELQHGMHCKVIHMFDGFTIEIAYDADSCEFVHVQKMNGHLATPHVSLDDMDQTCNNCKSLMRG